MNKLTKYNNKRNFNKTKEPIGIKKKSNKNLIFCVQHHLARRDHYDFRLELNGVLLSWAVPKGPSYNPKEKRLAVHTEDHPYDYHKFEGIIPKGEYGGGVVQLWDEGLWIPLEEPNKTYKEGYLKFILKGKRLVGAWTLVHFKENNWLLIKEKDNIKGFNDITKLTTSIKTGRTIKEIENNINKKRQEKIEITHPNKVIFPDIGITKEEVVKYYEKVSQRMLPFIENRIVSVKRCPEGIENNIFFKKHLEPKEGIKEIKISNNKDKKDNYYYIVNEKGLINEANMNSIEFHVGSGNIKKINNPDIMVFDLDPDENLSISKIRAGVKDLKKILDELKLESYLKTSGGKGYHVVVPFKNKVTWQEFKSIAKNIAELMENKWPDKYTSNVRKIRRKGKIYIDWVRNTKGATSIAPYSLRARANAPVSMPIKWSELDKIKPNEITIKEALKRLKRKDPWEGFFT